MKQQTYLHIPTPCHEDWNKMTQSEKGKFCNACSKQVVDFTLMSDQEVLNYFSKTSGNTCGRFATDQLQRPLEPVKIEKKKSWWIAAMMPLLLFFDKSYGQHKPPKQSNIVCTKKDTAFPLMGKVAPEIRPAPQEILVGKVVIAPPAEKIILRGNVADENDMPLISATIQLKGTRIATTTDISGNFTLTFQPGKNNVETIVVSYVGYLTEERTIDVNQYLSDENFILAQNEIVLPPIIIESSNAWLGEVVTVGYTVCRVVQDPTIIDTAKSVIKQIFNAQSFTIFPNPAPSGSPLNIDVKKEGDYTIALFDNSGKLLLVKDFTAVGTTVTKIEMPSVLSAGMYYVMVTNKKTKKQESRKIVME